MLARRLDRLNRRCAFRALELVELRDERVALLRGQTVDSRLVHARDSIGPPLAPREACGPFWVAIVASDGNKGVRWKELRWLFDTDLFWDRANRFAEASDCLLGLEYVENPEAVLALSGNMNEKALEREVGR